MRLEPSGGGTVQDKGGAATMAARLMWAQKKGE